MPDPIIVARNAIALHSGAALYARVTNSAGTNITQASLTSVAYQVRNLTRQTSGAKTALVIASVIFDSLQTGEGWSEVDGTGYNFATVIPASEFAQDPNADPSVIDHRFQVDVLFTPASGQPFVVPFQFTAKPTWIS